MSNVLLDAAGRRRSPATMPGFHAGRPPRNKGRALSRRSADGRGDRRRHARRPATTSHGLRLRGLIVVLWRAGLRIHEALALTEADLDAAPRRGARPPRQGRPPPRGRHGRLGLGATPALAGRPRRAAGRPAVLRPHRTRPAGAPWSQAAAARATAPHRGASPASAGASRRTSSATRTPSRWPAKASR